MSDRHNNPAGPCFEPNASGHGNAIVIDPDEQKQFIHFNQGMTIRERFAMAAMQGLCSNTTASKSSGADIAKAAVIMADELLLELTERNYRT